MPQCLPMSTLRLTKFPALLGLRDLNGPALLLNSHSLLMGHLQDLVPAGEDSRTSMFLTHQIRMIHRVTLWLSKAVARLHLFPVSLALARSSK